MSLICRYSMNSITRINSIQQISQRSLSSICFSSQIIKSKSHLFSRISIFSNSVYSSNSSLKHSSIRSFSTSTSSSSSAKNVGFIGLGAMGSKMCINLYKSNHSLLIYDVSKESTKSVIDECNSLSLSNTIKSVSTMSELVSSCHTIITMLPSSPHVSKVYTGYESIESNKEATKDSLLGSLVYQIKSSKSSNRPLLLDCSTIDVLTSKSLSQTAKSNEIILIDCPVSGGINGAKNATLTFMIGAENELQVNSATSILKHLGKSIIYCGTAGSGQAAKICNNLCLGISMIAVSESMNLGIKLGVDPLILTKIFNTSSARCWSSDTYNPVPGIMENVPSAKDYNGGFQTKLMEKDMRLAVSAAEACHVKLDIGKHAQKIYKSLMDDGLGEKDFSVIYKKLAQDNPNNNSKQ